MTTRSARNRRRATVAGAIVGLILIFTFVLSLVAPGLGSSNGDDIEFPTVTPFGTPAPTLTPTPVVFPTPDPDLQLEGEPAYVHSSGYFQVFRPAGSEWTVNERPASGVAGVVSAEPTYPSVFVQGGSRLVVIHNYIRQGVEYESLEALSENLLSVEYFNAAWGGNNGGYEQWTETAREITGEAVITDFDLISSGMPYLGRDISRLEGSTLYVARIVVPSNNPDLFALLSDLVPQYFVGYSDIQALPRAWSVYADQELGFMIKLPPTLTQVAGGSGLPATFRLAGESEPAITLRVSAELNRVLESEADAESWLLDAEPSAEVLETQALTHQYGEGYEIVYTYRDVSGDPQNGLVVLLNGQRADEPSLAIAQLQIAAFDLDLTDMESLPEMVLDVRRAVVDGFVTLPLGAQ